MMFHPGTGVLQVKNEAVQEGKTGTEIAARLLSSDFWEQLQDTELIQKGTSRGHGQLHCFTRNRHWTLETLSLHIETVH